MEIHLSVGVSTLVALMAAHRADAGVDRTNPVASGRGETAHVTPEPDAGCAPAVERDPSSR